MNILIISRQELPEFIRYYFQRNNTNIFYSRGPIKCQNILEKVNIHYILLFVDNNIKKIFNDLLLVLNQKKVPVIVIEKKISQNFQKQIKYYYTSILWVQDKEQILSALNTAFEARSKRRVISNLIFKHFFKKKQNKISVLSAKENKLFPLFSSLNISAKEKNELLSNFQKTNKKK